MANVQNLDYVYSFIQFKFSIGRAAPIVICQTSDSCCTITEISNRGFHLYTHTLKDQSFIQCNYMALKEGYRAARFRNGMSLEYQAFCVDIPGSVENDWLDLTVTFPEPFEVSEFEVMCTVVGKLVFHTVIQSVDHEKCIIRLFNVNGLRWKSGQAKLNVMLFSCNAIVVMRREWDISRGRSTTMHDISSYYDAAGFTSLISDDPDDYIAASLLTDSQKDL